MEFKFTASIIDAIEQTQKEPIGNVVSDNTIRNMARFIEKAGVKEDGTVGMSNSIALKKIDAYLEEPENDMDLLVLDVTEALVRDGFLSRDLSVEKMRTLKKTRAKQAMEEIDKVIEG
ncbi:hypothetical protein G7059_07905 [Erysipelothrix sp. HDW6A]|uniref:hypothetical protein n=1 Tax=Erysipelothrix sp. HDW6A TaxID=2714928 RepID=UPI00140C09D2|nr:hypothetical protein [Erysipelothrix sp. HDW6A]QIK57767.1 hypothetical protein G7059_07905 [Erysipelothrix sp. HDW6A]